MFNKKRIEKLERWSNYHKIKVDSFDNKFRNIVFCEECGVAIKKDKAQVVHSKCEYFIQPTQYIPLYYCQKHTKPYDKIEKYYRGKDRYYKSNVEVNKKGKLIKKPNK